MLYVEMQRSPLRALTPVGSLCLHYLLHNCRNEEKPAEGIDTHDRPDFLIDIHGRNEEKPVEGIDTHSSRSGSDHQDTVEMEKSPPRAFIGDNNE